MSSLNTFEATIRLNESKDYKRLTTVIYLLTGALLISSSLPWILTMMFCGFLFLQLRQVYFCAKPCLFVHSVNIKQHSWATHLISGKAIEYENAFSLLDTGLFQLILFSSEEKARKTLLLFHDQLSPKDRYILQRRLHA